jgi:hypothetical protein
LRDNAAEDWREDALCVLRRGRKRALYCNPWRCARRTAGAWSARGRETMKHENVILLLACGVAAGLES